MSTNLNVSQLFNVRDIVAVVTGGGSGLGRMIANSLAANGAKAVYIVGRRKEALDETAKLSSDGAIIPVVGDVTSKDSLSSIAERVRSEHGYLDVLVANSGMLGPLLADHLPKDRKPTVKEFQEGMWNIPMDDFTQASHLNCTAVFYTALAFLDLLDAGNSKNNVSQKSQIIITTSIAGLSRVPASGVAYSTSKAAAHHLAKVLSHYFLPYQIRVNSIAPGIYPSEMTQRLVDGREKKPWEEGSFSPEQIPLTRAGTEENMAGAALYLISNAGSYVNGEFLITDGGRLSMGLQ